MFGKDLIPCITFIVTGCKVFKLLYTYIVYTPKQLHVNFILSTIKNISTITHITFCKLLQALKLAVAADFTGAHFSIICPKSVDLKMCPNCEVIIAFKLHYQLFNDNFLFYTFNVSVILFERTLQLFQ